MLKRVFGRKLGRSTKARRALLRSLTASLVRDGQIKTTQAKAKAVVPYIEKIMTQTARGDESAKRRVFAKLGNDKATTEALFSDKYASLVASRKSGFVRTIKLPTRRGDAAKIVRLEWVEEAVAAKKEKKTKK